MIKIGINGFGRIGRNVLRAIIESGRTDIEVVAINDLGPVETNAHLIRFDSVHGRFPGEVKVDGDTIDVGRGPIRVTAIRNPAELPWGDVDIALECTGIFTDKVHTKAKIKTIDAKPLEKDLSAGKVIIVAGFQGINDEGHITTLGRGGSDLTAIALAAAIKADKCEIYTDVDGVYTADPRVVKDAQKLNEISYDEMLELASLGSKVMQTRSVEFASKYNVVFEVRSSFNNNPGTIVKQEVAYMEKVVVRGVAVDKDQAKVVVSDIADKPGTAAKVFCALAEANINVDMIVQNVGRDGVANLTFTVPQTEIGKVEKTLAPVLKEIGGSVTLDDQIAKLSVVGVGMRTHSGVASTLFTALAGAGINLELISTSEIKISVVIAKDKADEAARVAHKAFELEKL